MRRWLCGLFMALVCSAAPMAAEAQAESRGLAKTHFERGMGLVQDERWEVALREFDESLRLYPTQTALFNRALCLGLTGRPADGVGALDEWLSRYGSTASPDERAEAERERGRLRERVGRVDLEISGVPSAEITLEGEPSGLESTSGALYVNPGRHNISVRAEGFQDIGRWVTVEAGAAVSLVVAMGRTGPAPTPTPAPAQPPPPAAPVAENNPAACQDGVDNDGDALLDCFDPDCSAIVFCTNAAGSELQPGQHAAPAMPGAPALSASTEVPLSRGWSLAAGILGIGFGATVMGLGFASNSQLGFGGSDEAPIALGLSALIVGSVAAPVVNRGARSARYSGVRGCLGCRVSA